MESHNAGFPPFPHSLDIPSGFPHSHCLDDWVYVFSCPLYSKHRRRKGLVTDVSGPHPQLWLQLFTESRLFLTLLRYRIQ
jgi:hypothetical protein